MRKNRRHLLGTRVQKSGGVAVIVRIIKRHLQGVGQASYSLEPLTEGLIPVYNYDVGLYLTLNERSRI